MITAIKNLILDSVRLVNREVSFRISVSPRKGVAFAGIIWNGTDIESIHFFSDSSSVEKVRKEVAPSSPQKTSEIVEVIANNIDDLFEIGISKFVELSSDYGWAFTMNIFPGYPFLTMSVRHPIKGETNFEVPLNKKDFSIVDYLALKIKELMVKWEGVS